MTGEATEPLRCVECGRVQTAPVARGWRAYLTVDEDEPAEAIVYCPEYDEREFGATRTLRRRSGRGTAPPRRYAC